MGATTSFPEIICGAQAETFSATAPFPSFAQHYKQIRLQPQREIASSHGFELLICCSAVAGGITAHLKPMVPETKSR
jgi:hypothetical protein